MERKGQPPLSTHLSIIMLNKYRFWCLFQYISFINSIQLYKLISSCSFSYHAVMHVHTTFCMTNSTNANKTFKTFILMHRKGSLNSRQDKMFYWASKYLQFKCHTQKHFKMFCTGNSDITMTSISKCYENHRQ